MKNEKNYVGFFIPKIWQILKHFAMSFHQALTSYFGRVYTYMKYHSDFHFIFSGGIIALGVFGGFVFLAAIITTIVILIRRYVNNQLRYF